MAKITARLLSGDVLAELAVRPDMTLEELKRRLKKLQTSGDEISRQFGPVDVVFRGQKLRNEDMTLKKAGLSPGAEVQVVFQPIVPVTCSHRDLAGCDVDSLVVVNIPQGVRKIFPGAFQRCSSLVKVIIPDGVVGIGNSAFRDCSSLSSLTIPNSVISIEHAAFNNCSALRSLTIPDSVARIGMGAFKGCSLMTLTISEPLARQLSGFNDCWINTKECRCWQCESHWFEQGWLCPANLWRARF